MGKVSGIIPVYMEEKWRPECLGGVLSRTLRKPELVCIDDAFPERPGEILPETAP